MSWVRLDDLFFHHRKVVDLPPAAKLLFIAGLTHCSAQLTDGFISTGAARSIAGLIGVPANMAKQLVEVGMWHKLAGGYEVHDYFDYQPSAEAEKQRHAHEAERKRRWREANRGRGRDASRSPGQPRGQPRGQTPSATPSATPSGTAEKTGDPDPIDIHTQSQSLTIVGPGHPESENTQNGTKPHPPDPLVEAWLAVLKQPPGPKRRAKTLVETHAVIQHLRQHLDDRAIADRIAYLATTESRNRINSANYLLETCTRWAAERDLLIPPMDHAKTMTR